MTYTSTEIGDAIFVWSKRFSSIDRRMGKGNKSAVISAHGNVAVINGQFLTNPAYWLHYYGPHGYSLSDPGLKMFLDKTAKVTETVSSANAQQDYVLSKYQNKHNKKGESYEKGFFENTFDVSGDFDMDIITLRSAKKHNEGNKLTMRLSEVIRLVFLEGFEYEHFHCAFCRGAGKAVDVGLNIQVGELEFEAIVK